MAKLRGAFIGFGNIAALGHWPTYAHSEECEIVAVMDPSPARRQAAHALRPEWKTYDSVQKLLASEKLDFVDICTPPSSHAPLVLEALARGCHVLCEKPLTLSEEDYKAIAKASAKAKKTVFTVHNWKYAPIFQQALSIVREGRIGRVWHVEIFTLRNSHCKGVTQGSGSSEDWRKDAAIAGGGVLIDHGWHAFYLLLNLVQSDPERILAKMTVPVPGALEEAVQALVQFPEADAYVHLTWLSRSRRNSIMVQGQHGTLIIDDDRILLNTQDGKKEDIPFAAALSAGSHHADWFEKLLPDFVAEIRDPNRRGQNFKEAGWCLALTQAAYTSNRESHQNIPTLFPSSAPDALRAKRNSKTAPVAGASIP